MSILNLKIIESNSTHPFSNLKEEETLFKKVTWKAQLF
jgi:hypothetical protein